jgi:hypothetical protein
MPIETKFDRVMYSIQAMKKNQTLQKKLPEVFLKKYDVHVSRDSPFQQRLRLLQSMWREAEKLPVGSYGNYLPTEMAKKTLAGYLDDTIRDVVRTEVWSPKASGKVFIEPRIYDNLLSSQPMCFNLFAHLQQDLDLATRVFAGRCSEKVKKVTGIEFEWSPGRGDPAYTVIVPRLTFL